MCHMVDYGFGSTTHFNLQLLLQYYMVILQRKKIRGTVEILFFSERKWLGQILKVIFLQQFLSIFRVTDSFESHIQAVK